MPNGAFGGDGPQNHRARPLNLPRRRVEPARRARRLDRVGAVHLPQPDYVYTFATYADIFFTVAFTLEMMLKVIE